MQKQLKRTLLNAASAPYRVAGFSHFQWARGKLGKDPLFAALLEQELLNGRRQICDLGCGRGLLAAWFLAAEGLSQRRQWQADFAVPEGLTFSGFDLHASACKAGMQALPPRYGARVSLQVADICKIQLPPCDTVTLLDVLHYLSIDAQESLLDRIRAALPPGGLLIARVGNARGGWRFAFSQRVDRWVARVQGHPAPVTSCRSPAEWIQALEARGFAVQAQGMSEGTLFANVLLVARLPQVSQN